MIRTSGVHMKQQSARPSARLSGITTTTTMTISSKALCEGEGVETEVEVVWVAPEVAAGAAVSEATVDTEARSRSMRW